MRILLLAIVIACGLALASVEAADRSTPTDAIERTIAQQIEAFRQEDAEKAFSFASPAIRKQFGTADFFMSMVARGYPQVYRPRSFQFGERVTRSARTIQQVIVTGPDGATVAALYEMIRVDGRWRINGCRIARLPGQDV